MQVVQLSLGVASGLGPYLAHGTAAANVQLLTVAVMKLTWAAVLLLFCPCACGLTNAVVVVQCLSEGTASVLLAMKGMASTRYAHVCMCACVHVCMYACAHVRMCACVHVCLCACMHVHVGMCMCACAYVHMGVCICTCAHVCTCMCTYGLLALSGHD